VTRTDEARIDATPRRHGRGRRAAIAIAIAVPIVLGAVAIPLLWPRLREEWYLRQLASDDEGSRDLAARQLAEMGSVRSVRPLLRLAIADLQPEMSIHTPRYVHTPLLALYYLGATAAPTLVDVVLDQSETLETRRAAARMVATFGYLGVWKGDPALVETLLRRFDSCPSECRVLISFFLLYMLEGEAARYAALASDTLQRRNHEEAEVAWNVPLILETMARSISPATYPFRRDWLRHRLGGRDWYPPWIDPPSNYGKPRDTHRRTPDTHRGED